MNGVCHIRAGESVRMGRKLDLEDRVAAPHSRNKARCAVHACHAMKPTARFCGEGPQTLRGWIAQCGQDGCSSSVIQRGPGDIAWLAAARPYPALERRACAAQQVDVRQPSVRSQCDPRDAEDHPR